MSEKKVAVVTGGSSGIGRAVAHGLAAQGIAVINADINGSGKQPGVDHVKCDVSNADDIAHLYSHVKAKHGIPDLLISNAGQGIHEKLSEGDPEKWKRVIDVNIVGALRFIRAFLPEMLARKHGDIIFMSSTAGQHPYAYGGVYSASKAALNMIARTLVAEVAGELRVSLISPGVVDTSFFKNMISSNHTVEDIGWGSLSAGQVADIVVHLVQLPAAVHIPELTITPPKQGL